MHGSLLRGRTKRGRARLDANSPHQAPSKAKYFCVRKGTSHPSWRWVCVYSLFSLELTRYLVQMNLVRVHSSPPVHLLVKIIRLIKVHVIEGSIIASLPFPFVDGTMEQSDSSAHTSTPHQDNQGACDWRQHYCQFTLSICRWVCLVVLWSRQIAVHMLALSIRIVLLISSTYYS